MAETKLIRCVQIVGARVRYFPEKIANNTAFLRSFGFEKAVIEEIEIEPSKPFPVVKPIVKPTSSSDEKTVQTKTKKVKDAN